MDRAATLPQQGEAAEPSQCACTATASVSNRAAALLSSSKGQIDFPVVKRTHIMQQRDSGNHDFSLSGHTAKPPQITIIMITINI